MPTRRTPGSFDEALGLAKRTDQADDWSTPVHVRGASARQPVEDERSAHDPLAHDPVASDSAYDPHYASSYEPVADPWAASTGRSAAATTTADADSDAARRAAVRERGLNAWLALAVLLVIAGIGGIVDAVSGSTITGAFNIALIVGSAVAIIVVRRHSMFPIIVAPPLVYAVASVALLYVRSGSLSDRKVLLNAAASWLVYGFPAIAAATAAVLIVAGIRLIVRR